MEYLVLVLALGVLLGVVASVAVYRARRKKPATKGGRLLGVSGKPMPPEWGEPTLRPEWDPYR